MDAHLTTNRRRQELARLRYELDHRPEWLHVPAEGIAQLLDEVVV